MSALQRPRSFSNSADEKTSSNDKRRARAATFRISPGFSERFGMTPFTPRNLAHVADHMKLLRDDVVLPSATTDAPLRIPAPPKASASSTASASASASAASSSASSTSSRATSSTRSSSTTTTKSTSASSRSSASTAEATDDDNSDSVSAESSDSVPPALPPQESDKIKPPMALDPVAVAARLNAARVEDIRQAEIARARTAVTHEAEKKRPKSLSYEACEDSDDTRSAPKELSSPKALESPKAADGALRSAKELTVLRNQQLKIMQTYMNGADCTYSWTLLHECVSLGLTNTVRQQFWLMQSVESEQPVPPSIDELLAGGELPRVVYNQILTDLYRTVPEVAQSRPDIINDLYRGLVAHAILRPDIGYVQGMNCLWAPIILYITKPNHRLIMAEHLVRRILPHYFTTDMIGAMIDARVLGHYLHRLCPNLEARLCEALQMKRSDVRDMLTTICSTYFPTLYSRNIKLDICMRLWDLIMLHGPVALFEFTLRLLIYAQKHGWLAKCSNWPDFMRLLTTNLAALETLDKLLDVQIPEHNIIVNDFNCRRKASARTVFIGMSMIDS